MIGTVFCVIVRCNVFMILLAFCEFDSLERVFNTTSVTNNGKRE